ncbi:MAG: enoyl-CoA hydratase-related protein [Solirubrobacteraceae bacterium]
MSSSDETPRVQAEVSHQLLTLTLDRPERRNALDPAMRDELAAALDDAARSASIRAVIITGAGGS